MAVVSIVKVSLRDFFPKKFNCNQNEVDLLGKIHHPNVITLLGYCVHEDMTFLAYELMHNGSLGSQLYGCSDWIEMRCPLEDIRDFQFCSYRGKIFVASGIDVYVCDFGWLGWNPSIYKILTVRPEDAPVRDERVELSYLVELDGDLLFVLVYYGCCEKCYPDYKFQAFKLEFGWQQVKLVELKSLGDKSLFLGLKSSFFLTASKYPGCKPNCIYLPMISYNYTDRSITQLLINYDFEKEESVLVHDDSDPEDLNMLHCAWFTPNLLK